MKKTVLAVLIIALLAVSCKSGPQINEDTPVSDETFRSIYNRYSGDLILEGAETYTVQSGDTLSAIARRVYQDGFYYPLIMLASSSIVLDPDKIMPGMELTIPNLQTNLDSRRARAAIKGVIMDCAQLESNRGREETARGLRNHADSL